ncbi:unnamed protein product [Haemonchus placei]|uniref:Ig-like domain-containing protein n=1 Tax=Haemonchus placei TaxID=6290 RepID=A0A0N4W2K6_HAEPC|nr:unnamed protein product [Haemonchus placei]
MRTFWGRKGKSITIPCTLPLPNDTHFSLEWRKDNKLIMSAYGAESGHAAPSQQGNRYILPYLSCSCESSVCLLVDMDKRKVAVE